MAQLYLQKNAQPDTWVMSGAPTATTVFLSLAATINYSDGTSDTLPANTKAVLPDATTVFDRTHDVYVPYTVQGSGVLSIIKESLLPTLTSAYAPLARVELHGIKPYQPEPYLAGGVGTLPATTSTVLASSVAARALRLWNGSTNDAPPASWQTPAFDDSAWGAAASAALAAGQATAAGTTALWPLHIEPNTPVQALVRQRFVAPPGLATAATLLVRYDDTLHAVYLNGTALTMADTTVGGDLQDSARCAVDPTLLLPAASNVLALWVEDVNPAPVPGNETSWVSFGLEVTVAGSGGLPDPGGTEGDLLSYHDGAWIRLPIGASGQELTVVSGDPAWATPPASGSVTSVAFSGPTGTSVSGSPITSSGTIALSWASQSANTVLGAPNGSSGAPTFRLLVAADIPNLPASQITSGQLAAARGGTGVDGSAASNGQLLIGTGSGYTLATITAGSGVTVTNSSGGISIAATGSGGTVTSVALTVPSFLSVSGSPITGSGTLAVTLANESANTVFAGPASGSAAAPTFRAVQPADLPTAPTAGGHVHAHGHFL